VQDDNIDLDALDAAMFEDDEDAAAQ